MNVLIKIKKLVPHVMFILSGIVIFLMILDNFNPTMNFLDNAATMTILWIFCIISLMNAVGMMIANHKKESIRI